MLGFINKNRINFKNIRTFNVLCFSLVRSNLEFGSVIWSPIYTTYIKHTENVQNKFFLIYCSLVIPLVILTTYKLSLREFPRRKVADLMILYDILNGNIDSTELFSMIGFNFGNHRWRKNNLFHVPFCYNNYNFDTYFSKVLLLANQISVYIEFLQMSRNVFKQNAL